MRRAGLTPPKEYSAAPPGVVAEWSGRTQPVGGGGSGPVKGGRAVGPSPQWGGRCGASCGGCQPGCGAKGCRRGRGT